MVHRVPDEQDLATANGGQERPVSIRQLLPRLLSEELQLYFSRVTIAIERGGSTAATRQQQDAALVSVARDTGLQELVPFFCRYISTQLYQHIGNVEHCRTLIRLTRSLLMNPHLHLELQVRVGNFVNVKVMFIHLTSFSFSCTNSCRHSLPVWWPRRFHQDHLTIIGLFALKRLKFS
jgi:hypothetical protein